MIEQPQLPREVRESGGKTGPKKSRKNRRSAVYLYLLILFGMAFLMLLLAYFIQQRSSTDAISDMQDLSRAELWVQIRALKEQNEAPDKEPDRLNAGRQAYEEEVQGEIRRLGQGYSDALEKLYGRSSFWSWSSTIRRETSGAAPPS